MVHIMSIQSSFGARNSFCTHIKQLNLNGEGVEIGGGEGEELIRKFGQSDSLRFPFHPFFMHLFGLQFNTTPQNASDLCLW